jgi:hypothetical protein
MKYIYYRKKLLKYQMNIMGSNVKNKMRDDNEMMIEI